MVKFKVTIKVQTEAKNEEEAINKAWEYLCFVERDHVRFEVEKLEKD